MAAIGAIGSRGAVRTTSSTPSTTTSATQTAAASGGYNSTFGGYYDLLNSIYQRNNEFNVSQVDKMNKFNADEAQKNRDWQEKMSNTSYQRAVEDLKAAGLNPALAYMNLGGASTPSGSSASGGKATADQSMSGLISLISASISASSAANVASIYAENQRWLQENNPNSLYGIINRLLSDFGGDSDSNVSKLASKLKNGINAYYGDGSKGFLNPGQIAKGIEAFKK